MSTLSQLHVLTSPGRLFSIPKLATSGRQFRIYEITNRHVASCYSSIFSFYIESHRETQKRKNAGAHYPSGIARGVYSSIVFPGRTENAIQRNHEVALVVCLRIIVFSTAWGFIRINFPPRAKPPPDITRNFSQSPSFCIALGTSCTQCATILGCALPNLVIGFPVFSLHSKRATLSMCRNSV